MKKIIREWVETIVVALVLALIIRAFVVQVFYIPSGSMEPTLNIKDRIVVNKFIYWFREPRREEIIVFKLPERPGQPSKDLIKRIIGLPNETLEVKDGIVFVNAMPLSENHLMVRDRAHFGPVKIPEGSYFMMGDNRGNSADSRYWGFLPKKNIIGLTFLRIWPLLKFGPVP